jgi:hypothetical protein
MTRLPLPVIKVQIPTAVVFKVVHYLLVVQYLFTETDFTVRTEKFPCPWSLIVN